MSSNWIVAEAGRDFIPTQKQIDFTLAKLQELAPVNAPVQAGLGWRVWAVFDPQGNIVGNLCVVQHWVNEERGTVMAEIGVNFWGNNPTAAYRAAERWAKNYLWLYTHFMCRVLSTNKPIQRMLERFGFTRTLALDGVEVWGVAWPDAKWLSKEKEGNNG